MYTRSSGRKIVSARTRRVPSISCFFASLVSPDGPVMVTTGMDFLLLTFDAAHQLQGVSGELSLRRCDHRIDAIVPHSTAMRIDIRRVFRPDLAYQRPASIRV